MEREKSVLYPSTTWAECEELIKKIDEVAEQTGRTRNEIVLMLLEFSLDNIVIK